MAIIPQLSLFAWEEIEELGDLERLRLVIEYMPDEQLMRVLEKERGKGRDDYPIRAMWNALWAGIVFQHDSDAKLLRELAEMGNCVPFADLMEKCLRLGHSADFYIKC